MRFMGFLSFTSVFLIRSGKVNVVLMRDYFAKQCNELVPDLIKAKKTIFTLDNKPQKHVLQVLRMCQFVLSCILCTEANKEYFIFMNVDKISFDSSKIDVPQTLYTNKYGVEILSRTLLSSGSSKSSLKLSKSPRNYLIFCFLSGRLP